VAEPDLSVVIPTFRRERQLVEAIASALRQPKVSVEVIVIDDSADGSAEAAVASLAQAAQRLGQPVPNPISGYGLVGAELRRQPALAGLRAD